MITGGRNRCNYQDEKSELSNECVVVFSEDVFVLHNKDGKDPEIFGLFSTTR